MVPLRKLSWPGVLLVVLLAAGCYRAASTAVPAGIAVLDEGALTVTGPYTHQNLSVYLLHADKQDDMDYLTLDQGLKDGLVKVTEKESGQVNELQLENSSDRYLFLQEGDRLEGGKQDRIIITSLVVPPRSGTIPVPANCIEHGRWHEGSMGVSFYAASNAALAPKPVRSAAKGLDEVAENRDVGGDVQGIVIRGQGMGRALAGSRQSMVWDAVAKEKSSAARTLNAPNTNSSLNETLDAPEVKKLSDDCAKALSGVLKDHSDTVGVAIAVNGKIEEVNVYPNHRLLAKLYPRLLESYAVQAAVDKDKAKEAAPSADAVHAFMAEGKEKAHRTDEVNGDNRLQVYDMTSNTRCATEYAGKAVHRQWMAKGDDSGRAPGRPLDPDNMPPRGANPDAPTPAPNPPPR
jgi:hypothetical protein